jgi:hypothetical protein
LSKSPINNDTQEALEKYLSNASYINIKKDNSVDSNSLIDYRILNANLAKILIDNNTNLNNILNNFRSVYNNKKYTKRRSQKETSRFFLNLLLSEISNESVIAIMYGRLMRIITAYNRFYTNEVSLDIFQDMCSNLIKEYIYSLYIKHIESLFYNKADIKKMRKHSKEYKRMLWVKMQEYTLSD